MAADPADERQDDIAWPPPAKHEVEKAGTPLLPGMDEVPERPEEGRPSWTA